MVAPNVIGQIGDIVVTNQVSVSDLVASLVGILSLIAIYFAYLQLRTGQRTQRTQLVIRLYQEFIGDIDRRKFFYRLDYTSATNAWKFSAEDFPHSAEEVYIDKLLYYMSFVGSLARKGDLTKVDLSWLTSECRILLENDQVKLYLKWLRSEDQIPNHSAFNDAVFLYSFLVRDKIKYQELRAVYP
jgi:hypothetical protein